MSEEEKEQQGIFAPENYRELCKPFPNAAEAEKSLNAFWDDLYELRNKHHMTDVHVIVRVPIAEHHVMTSFHCGDSLLGESMTAWAFGLQQASRQENIARVVEEAGQSVKARRSRK